MSDPLKKLFDNIDKGVEAYHQGVRDMTDKELYDHCFNDKSKEGDFCLKEAKRRGITKDGYNCYACQNGCPVCGGSGFIIP